MLFRSGLVLAYDRRFFCRELPDEYNDGDIPTLIIQSYYVHADNYALRVRLVSHKVSVNMTPDIEPIAVLDEHREQFSEAFVTVKGPSVGGTRYEVEREIDARIAAELIKRGGEVVIKNRYSVWIADVNLMARIGLLDDIDHLGNRRVLHRVAGVRHTVLHSAARRGGHPTHDCRMRDHPRGGRHLQSGCILRRRTARKRACSRTIRRGFGLIARLIHVIHTTIIRK